MDIRNIIDAIQTNKVRITDHADEESEADRITFDEVCFSILHGEIIEDYPNDKPYPSCLIHGRSSAGDPVHSVWAFNERNLWAVLVTVYRPDPERWVNWRERRREP